MSNFNEKWDRISELVKLAMERGDKMISIYITPEDSMSITIEPTTTIGTTITNIFENECKGFDPEE